MSDMISHAIILDFEATCDNLQPVRPQEIIEFPSVLMSLETSEVIDEFESFVRPYHNPVLTDFCREFTSITQEEVGGAPYFHEVFAAHEQWLSSHGLTASNSVFATCGDWDLGTMFPAQCRIGLCPVEVLSPVYTQWLNIKVPYSLTMGRKAPGMAGMLRGLEIPIAGMHHRGIDDCRNITKILGALVARGVEVEPTARLAPEKYPPINLLLRFGNSLEPVVLSVRNLKTLRGLASRCFKCEIKTFRRSDGVSIESSGQLLQLQSGEEIILA